MLGPRSRMTARTSRASARRTYGHVPRGEQFAADPVMKDQIGRLAVQGGQVNREKRDRSGPLHKRAALLSLATSVPGYVVRQADVVAHARTLFGRRYSDFERLSAVFENSGIRRRHAVKPVDWYLEQRGWRERTAAYLDGAAELFVVAAEKALAGAQ